MSKKMQMFYRYRTVLILLLVVAAFSAAIENFFTLATLTNILWSTSLVGIMTAGAIYPIITGGIDLSVGSVIGLTTCLLAKLMVEEQWGFGPALVMVLGVGMLIGLCNGLLTVKLKLPAFVATMAMMMIVKGIAMVWSGGKTIAIMEGDVFIGISTFKIFNVPFPVYLMLLVMLISYWILSKHSFGRKIIACGGNPAASRLSCVNVDWICITGYVISGFCAAVAGVVMASLTQQGRATMGAGYEMDVITAIVLGGASLAGGKGSIWGSLFGTVLVGTISAGMTMLNAPTSWHAVVKGLIIMLAVAFDVYVSGLQHRQKKVKA